jgi:hypothetical protein
MTPAPGLKVFGLTFFLFEQKRPLALVFDLVFQLDRCLSFLKIVWQKYQRFPFPLQVLAKVS